MQYQQNARFLSSRDLETNNLNKLKLSGYFDLTQYVNRDCTRLTFRCSNIVLTSAQIVVFHFFLSHQVFTWQNDRFSLMLYADVMVKKTAWLLNLAIESVPFDQETNSYSH